MSKSFPVRQPINSLVLFVLPPLLPRRANLIKVRPAMNFRGNGSSLVASMASGITLRVDKDGGLLITRS